MKILKSISLILNSIVVFSMLSCSSSAPETQWERKVSSGQAQGTFYNVIWYDTLANDYSGDIKQLLDDFNFSASIYEPLSVISKVNKNQIQQIDDSTFKIIFGMAQQVSDETEGAFDITVGPLFKLWGFKRKNNAEVTDAEIKEVLSYVGYQKISLRNDSIVKLDSNVQISFDAIAQGYSVDLICEFFNRHGIENYMVEVGGELRTSGWKPDQEKAWVIGIDKPLENGNYEHELQAELHVNTVAVATSGNYRTFIEQDGKKMGHSLNPKTGYPANNELLSVTILHENCALADAYATAFMVMGLQKAKDFVENRHDIEALLIYHKGKEVISWESDGFRKLMNN